MTAKSPNWIERYEALRPHSLGALGPFEAPGWALVLLVQQGVQGWMRAWRDPLHAAKAEPGSMPAPVQGPVINSHETTLVLANMAMRSLAVSP
jgi:hypothetical protein